LAREDVGTVALAAEAQMDLWAGSGPVAAPDGAYVVVLEAEDDAAVTETDLVYLPPGRDEWGLPGLRRALVVSSPGTAVAPPPDSWERVPAAPFAPFEEAPAGQLPVDLSGMTVEAVDATRVRVRVGESEAEVPRYWLARMLFRIALHGYAIGYLETYGGFYYDDRTGHRLGLRDGGAVSFTKDAITDAVETLYRAVAPEGYVERLE
jgi:hypothetical protein